MLQRKAVNASTFELLVAISSIEELREFNLAGGTALALQIGHRISYDLDFFGTRPFLTEEILPLVDDLGKVTIVSQHKNILILNIGGIKVDFVNYKYPLLQPIIDYSPIRLLALPDIAAMKLAAIAGRGRKRDFFDLFYLLKYFSLTELIGFYNQKYPDGSEMMVGRSLTYFEDADNDEEPNVFEAIQWLEVKNKISNLVKLKYG
jgi:hypothetical protein